MEKLETIGDALAAMGHNQPPEPTRFEAISGKIGDLFAEAKQWLDGAPVTTQGQADSLNLLIGMISEAAKEADDLRKAEAKPFDDAKAEVQERYNALIGNTKSVKGKTVLAIEAAKKALTPWLEELDRRKREAAEAARKEAEVKQKEAQEAMRAARESADLEAREEAERLAKEAKKADQAANAAANDTAKAKGGSGRATSLRSFYSAEITDSREFARWVWTSHKVEMETFLESFARQLVAANHDRKIPGVKINEERRAV